MTCRRAVADAMAMKTVTSTIMPWPELAEGFRAWNGREDRQ